MLKCGMICLTKQIVIHLVYNVCLWLNVFPLKSGLSVNYSPRELVTQRSVSYKTDCKAEFGSYVESSTNAMVTNIQIPRHNRCIALGLSGIIQGSLKCFDFKNGSVVTRRIFHVSPCLIESSSKWILGGWIKKRKSEKSKSNFRITKANFFTEIMKR